MERRINIHSFIVILLLILELLAQLVKRSKSQPDQSEYELIEFFSGAPEKLYGSARSEKVVVSFLKLTTTFSES